MESSVFRILNSLRLPQFWLDNKYGDRDFWEATIYGRQLFPADFHVCAIDSTDFKSSIKKKRDFACSLLNSEPNQET